MEFENPQFTYLKGDTCLCGDPKKKGFSFCSRCYGILAEEDRERLLLMDEHMRNLIANQPPNVKPYPLNLERNTH